MNNYFEVKIKYEKIDERGAVVKVSEPYLIDAMTFTEAEARAIKELEPYLSGDFFITNVARANLTDLFPSDDGDRWFKCKITYVTLDEERGKELRKSSYVLVQANNVKHAWDNLEKAMDDYLGDYEVNKIEESAIMDVFPYDAAGTDGFVPTINDDAKKALSDRIYDCTTQVLAMYEEGSCLSIERIASKYEISKESATEVLNTLVAIKAIAPAKDNDGVYKLINTTPAVLFEAVVGKDLAQKVDAAIEALEETEDQQ